MARKKSTKKISPVVQQYNRERGRIQRQINRMRKRGYLGMEDMLPPKPKRITKASVRRLKRITTKDLYDKADFVDLTTGEVVATGKQGRVIERKRAAQKAAQTRARRRHDAEMVQRGREQWEREHPEAEEEGPSFADEVDEAIQRNREEMEERWRQKREQADAENRRRMEQDEQYASQFGNGEMMRQHVLGILGGMRTEFPSTVADLERMIENAEGDEGEERFWDRISEYPELLDSLQEVFYKSGDHISPIAFNKVRSLIMNRPMSAQESRDAQDLYERDQMQAFDIDEEP